MGSLFPKYLGFNTLYFAMSDIVEESIFLLSLNIAELYIEGLCHGNLSEEEAISLSNIFKTNFSVNPLPIGLRYDMFATCSLLVPMQSEMPVLRTSWEKKKELCGCGNFSWIGFSCTNTFHKQSVFDKLKQIFHVSYFGLFIYATLFSIWARCRNGIN